MSWLEPDEYENWLVKDVAERWHQIMPLARLLAPATRIETRLLRNVRLEFLPDAGTELEAWLWFSPLVSTRGDRVIVLHPGVARFLSDELQESNPALHARVRHFIDEHTRHWRPEDRLEQELRHLCLAQTPQDTQAFQARLQDVLRRIHHGSVENGLAIARWARYTLPQITRRNQAEAASEEVRLLAQFAAHALGSVAPWTDVIGPPSRLPDWLSAKLPQLVTRARVALDLAYEASRQTLVLRVREAKAQEPAIALPSTLPAKLFVQGEGRAGQWYGVAHGSCIELPVTGRTLRIVTLAGQQYDLIANWQPPPPPPADGVMGNRLYLSHVSADAGLAQEIAVWLRDQGIALEVVNEDELPSLASRAAATDSVRLLRLWTAQAQALKPSPPPANGLPEPATLILRVGRSKLAAGHGTLMLDLSEWPQRDGPERQQFLHALRGWLLGESTPGIEANADAVTKEVTALLAELQDPKTEPPRRLAIGDRLAELGDPRRGVGVKEFDAPDFEEAEAKPAFRPEVQRLLAEWNDPATKPPRRLKIGDKLAKMGDPRPGVGLDGRGLPDIAWVAIPGGEAAYKSEVLVPDKPSRRKRPARRLVMPGFHLARYPVTNAQFQAFVDAGGYKDRRWWAGLHQPEPTKSRWEQANRPRTDVDWYEATAFCRWLSAQRGYEVRLPTEQEWEWAARGAEGRPYPWGNDYRSGFANVDEKFTKAGPWYLRQTTAAGAYPHGSTPQGVADLAGNVWEWCANDPDELEDLFAPIGLEDHLAPIGLEDSPGQSEPVGEGSGRALRGGSWDIFPDFARGVTRDWRRPESRSDDVGFRVCSSAPIAAGIQAPGMST